MYSASSEVGIIKRTKIATRIPVIWETHSSNHSLINVIYKFLSTTSPFHQSPVEPSQLARSFFQSIDFSSRISTSTRTMSYLENQICAFKSAVTSSSSKISNKRTTEAATKSSPSLAPSSRTPTSKKQELKRKQTDQSNAVYSQPANTGAGRNIMTQITYAIEHLKTKGIPLRFKELLSYLSLQNENNEHKRIIETILRSHDRVDYEGTGDGREGTYRFRPFYNICSGKQLLGILQSQPTAQGLDVRELRDGWPGVEDAVDKLEAEGKLLVTRNKKDNHARMVWPDDPSLALHIDDEFQAIWQKIKLPEAAALADELEKANLTPANKSRGVRVIRKALEKKTKQPRKGGKVTNRHMPADILRDYPPRNK